MGPKLTVRASAALPVLAALLTAVLLPTVPTRLAALDVPPLTGRVVDNANMIGSAAEREINDYLQSVEASTGAQIAVLTVSSLEGDPLENFSIRVVDRWKLGGADRDNGVLLLVAAAEKKIRLEVGYGLEGVLTDAKSGLIIREVLQPRFQRGDFERGISEAVQVIGKVASGDPDAVPAASSAAAGVGSAGQAIGELLFTGFIVFLVLGVGAFGRRRRYGGFWRAMFLGSLLGGAGRRTGGSGFRGGGFGGGFGGGGFSGGGGGFGGGGASGGW